MNISESMKSDLSWWIENVHSQKRIIDRGNADTSIRCDTSLEGWGAVHEKEKTNGRWTNEEKDNHINYLELLAIFNALKILL